jgi:hypothetical protein
MCRKLRIFKHEREFRSENSSITRSELRPEGYHPKVVRVATENW